MQHCLAVFPSVDYAFTTIPTYPSGQIGFLMCSTSPGAVLRRPVREPAPALQAQLKYYDPAVHAAAFVLPRFAEAVVSRSRQPALPHVCSSVAPTLLSRRSLALAAAGALVSAAALATVRRR